MSTHIHERQLRCV